MTRRTRSTGETDWQRGSDEAAFFRCLRAKWPTLLAPGTKIVSLVQLSLPRVGTHSLGYRLVFENKGSRIAILGVSYKAGVGGMEGRALVERTFDIERQTAALESFYDSLVGRAT